MSEGAVSAGIRCRLVNLIECGELLCRKRFPLKL